MQEKKTHRNRHISVDISDLYDSTYNIESENASSNNIMSEESVSYIDDVDGIMTKDGYMRIDKNTLIDQMVDVSIQCIDYLPDNYKLVLKEQLVNKKKINQIAEDNQIPMTTIVNWLYKGKIKLQEIIKDKYKDLYESYRSYYPSGI